MPYMYKKKTLFCSSVFRPLYFNLVNVQHVKTIVRWFPQTASDVSEGVWGVERRRWVDYWRRFSYSFHSLCKHWCQTFAGQSLFNVMICFFFVIYDGTWRIFRFLDCSLRQQKKLSYFGGRQWSAFLTFFNIYRLINNGSINTENNRLINQQWNCLLVAELVYNVLSRILNLTWN